MPNPSITLEFDTERGEFKEISLENLKDIPLEKLHFAFSLLQQWVIGVHTQKLLHKLQQEQSRRIVMPGPNNFH